MDGEAMNGEGYERDDDETQTFYGFGSKPAAGEGARGDVEPGDIGRGDIGRGDVEPGDVGRGDVGRGDVGRGDVGRPPAPAAAVWPPVPSAHPGLGGPPAGYRPVAPAYLPGPYAPAHPPAGSDPGRTGNNVPPGYGQPSHGQSDYAPSEDGRPEYGFPEYGRPEYTQPTYGQSDHEPAHGQSPHAQSPYAQPPFAQSPYPQAAHERDADRDTDGFGRDLEPVRSRRMARRADEPGRDEEPGWRERAAQARRTMPLWQELPLLLVVAFCLAVLIRTFLLQAFYIPSSSMEETLLVGDRVLVNKIVYDVRQPDRGEVIVFRGTDNWAPENPPEPAGSLVGRIGRTLGDLVGVSRPGEKDFIKRVIGLPGDRVSCCDPAGRVYVNGQGIDEPYIHVNSALDVPPSPGTCGSRRFAEILVPPGQVFVMGDNRIVSQDSRCQGPVPIENVIGRAFVIVWPSDRWDNLSVPSTFDNVPGPVAIGRPAIGRPARSPSAHAVAAAAVTLPILASLVVSARTARKRRWGRRTLSR